jgi:uncharacterized protein (DUF433 family)
MDWRGHIVADPDILGGKPTFKGTRISVALMLRWLASGWTHEQLIENYPHLTRDNILAALAFAAELIEDQRSAARRKAATGAG